MTIDREAFYLGDKYIQPVGTDWDLKAQQEQLNLGRPEGHIAPMPDQPPQDSAKLNLGMTPAPRDFVNPPPDQPASTPDEPWYQTAMHAIGNAVGATGEWLGKKTGEYGDPNWQRILMGLAGGAEGFASGFRGQPSQMLQYSLNRKRLQQAQNQLDQEKRQKMMESYLDAAYKLPKAEFKQFYDGIKDDLEKVGLGHLKPLADEIADNPAMRKSAVAMLNGDPVRDRYVKQITEQQDQRIADIQRTVAAKDQSAEISKVRQQAQTEISSMLRDDGITKESNHAALGVLSLQMAQLSPDIKAHIKGMQLNQFADEMEQYIDPATKQPVPKYLSQFVRSLDPDMQDFLHSQYGIETPKAALDAIDEARKKRIAKEEAAIKEDVGNDRESITKELYQKKYSKDVKFKDLEPSEQANVNKIFQMHKVELAEQQGAAATKSKRLDESAQSALTGLDLLGRLIDKLDKFPDSKIERYIGPVESRVRKYGQGVLKDPEFAKWQAILSQEVRSWFEIGGKTLTAAEMSALTNAMPSGKELSLVDFKAKVAETREVIKSIRESRIKYGSMTVGELSGEKPTLSPSPKSALPSTSEIDAELERRRKGKKR